MIYPDYLQTPICLFIVLSVDNVIVVLVCVVKYVVLVLYVVVVMVQIY